MKAVFLLIACAIGLAYCVMAAMAIYEEIKRAPAAREEMIRTQRD
jgi:hypothetical protein